MSVSRRWRWQHHAAIEVTNEPILEFKPGSPERAALQKVPLRGIGILGVWFKVLVCTSGAAQQPHALSWAPAPSLWEQLGLSLLSPSLQPTDTL